VSECSLELEERCDELLALGRPPTAAELRPLVRDFYALDGNAAGGTLHIVLDDGNLDRKSVEWARNYAHNHGDTTGAALAEVLLAMTDADREAM
jgi:hypothetical protein